jgi:mRNA interferase MazF
MKPGDIVLIRFPQTDLLMGKLLDEIVDPSDSDYASTGLKVRSVVRLARLASVEASVINARLGNISQQRLRQIRKHLADWLQK